MNFPIFGKIKTASANFPTAAILKIDGNAGGIPPSFQNAQFTADDDGEPEKLLCQDNTRMTADQWAEWGTQADEPYILACVAENLGLELEPIPEKPAKRSSRRIS